MNEVSGFFARYCDRCIHSHLDPARGVVCGLTRQRPDTSRPCGDLALVLGSVAILHWFL